MSLLSFFDISNTLVNIPIGDGYAMSYIEAIGTVFGLLCIWLASQEKTINFLFGLINVTLFGVIFFQIQLYGLLLLQVFFFIANAYGWYAWTRPSTQGDHLQIRWLNPAKMAVTAGLSALAIAWMTFNIDPFFQALSTTTVDFLNLFGAGLDHPVLEPDAFPFWDSSLTVLSIVGQILMTRKYVENWILWAVIDLISIGVYASQGVYVMALQYSILFFVAVHGTRQWALAAKSNPVKLAVESSKWTNNPI